MYTANPFVRDVQNLHPLPFYIEEIHSFVWWVNHPCICLPLAIYLAHVDCIVCKDVIFPELRPCQPDISIQTCFDACIESRERGWRLGKMVPISDSNEQFCRHSRHVRFNNIRSMVTKKLMVRKLTVCYQLELKSWRLTIHPWTRYPNQWEGVGGWLKNCYMCHQWLGQMCRTDFCEEKQLLKFEFKKRAQQMSASV